MFNIQGSEIIIIVLVALIVLGPEKLPDAIRRASKAYAELRKMSTGFQSELRSALDEPMRELRETADLVRKNADFREMMQPDTAAPSSTASSGAAATSAADAPSASQAGPPTAPAPGLDPVVAAEHADRARDEAEEELPYEVATPGEPIDGPVTQEQRPEAADQEQPPQVTGEEQRPEAGSGEAPRE